MQNIARNDNSVKKTVAFINWQGKLGFRIRDVSEANSPEFWLTWAKFENGYFFD